MNTAPVFVVDDDHDDHVIIQDIWNDLNVRNQLLFFETGQALLDHLKKDSTNPFLIICDVNLPQMDGFELRERFSMQTDLRYKSIPFIFWSTSASNEQIKKAYDVGAHGFFLKGESYKMIKESLELIISYWSASKAPVIHK